MTLKRITSLASATAAAVLLLAACGSDDNSGGSSSDSSGDIDCAEGDLSGSGSSAQANAVGEWINAYQAVCEGATINYNASGSGAGVQDFINEQVPWAGSDSALKEDEVAQADARCGDGNKAINIPLVGGAIAVGYNVEGIDSLVLTPEVLSGIFGNEITTWNDPKIAELNPDATLPDATIAQFHRSDESGTTDNFTKYLTAAGGWTFEGGKTWTAPGGQGAKGSDQVATSVKDTPNSIGYFELSFALSQNVTAAQIDNGGGAVEATSENAAATIAGATITGEGNNLPLTLDYTVADAGQYPIVLVTYQITCEKGLDSGDLALVKSFLTYAASDAGQGILGEIGYVPMTGDLLTKVQAAIAALS